MSRTIGPKPTMKRTFVVSVARIAASCQGGSSMAQHAHLPVQLPWQASEYPHGSQPPGAVYSRACPPLARDITARYGVRLRTIGPDTGRVRVISGGSSPR